MYIRVSPATNDVLVALPTKQATYTTILMVMVYMQVLTGFRRLLADETDARLMPEHLLVCLLTDAVGPSQVGVSGGHSSFRGNPAR